jgi:hypothetical protein
MNEIERALATLQDLLDNSIFTSRIDFALEVAIEALQDRLKAKKEETPSDWTKNKACRDAVLKTFGGES